MKVQTDRFPAASSRAVHDELLQIALKRGTSMGVKLREQTTNADPHWQYQRERAHQVKQRAIARLPELLERMEAEVVRRGGHVFWARDGAEATRYVVELARRRGARRAIKGKSMTTEEIDLNHALEEAGIEAVETDLGEYIVQLAEETPSHILVPAMHKRREDIAALFDRKFGARGVSDAEGLAGLARERLRQLFLTADLGVAGANVAIAESGTLLIVENEGNQRMCNTLPRTFVAVVGIEKVVESFDDAGALLRVLTRAASGQKLTTYVSLLTGPRAAPEEAGPEELHVILLDGGRTRILDDPVGRQALYCIRCAACLNVCPVYQSVGGHAYGWVYPGPIGAIVTPYLVGLERSAHLPYASTLCGACSDVCPVKIDLPRVLLHHRQRAAEAGLARPFERPLVGLYGLVMRHPRLYRWASWLVARLGRLLPGRDGWLRRLPPPFGAWTRQRDFPSPSPRSFHQRWRDREEDE